MPRYVIHIGPTKTGSSYLQSLFFHGRKTLAKHGVCYPADWWNRPDEVRHARLARLLNENARGEVLGPFREIRRAGHRIVLLSCEDFANMSVEACELLREATDGSPVDIVYYSRRWSERIRSHWQQDIKMGGLRTLPEFLMIHYASAMRQHAINYASRWEKWAGVFGREALRIVSHSNLRDRNVNTMQHFTQQFLGFDEPLTARPGLIQHHHSPDALDTEIMRSLNRLDRLDVGQQRMDMRIKYWERRGELDTAELKATMSRHMEPVAIDDEAEVFAGVWHVLHEWADRLVTPELGATMFRRERREFSVVHPDYLFETGARERLLDLYESLKTARSDNPELVYDGL